MWICSFHRRGISASLMQRTIEPSRRPCARHSMTASTLQGYGPLRVGHADSSDHNVATLGYLRACAGRKGLDVLVEACILLKATESSVANLKLKVGGGCGPALQTNRWSMSLKRTAEGERAFWEMSNSSRTWTAQARSHFSNQWLFSPVPALCRRGALDFM